MSQLRKGNMAWKRRYPRKAVEALLSERVTFPDRDPNEPLPMPDDLYPKGWLEAAEKRDKPRKS